MDFQLTEEQRLVQETARDFVDRELIPPVREPEAGSDAGNLQTTARPEKDEWVLNGQKRFISNGSIADFVQVYAREPGTKGHDGISLFMVPKEAPGFKVTHVETTTKLGLRASP